jgi:molecular chaperone GrpE
MDKEEAQSQTEAQAGAPESAPAGEQPAETNAATEPAEAAADQAEVNSADAVAQDGISDLLNKLDAVTAEANLQRERYLRAVADLENFRKRSLREKEEARRSANSALVEDLLPILDNFALGLASARQHEGGEAFAQGFAMILKQMSGALAGNGVEEINPLGAEFDPNFHESHGLRHDAETPEGHVVEVHRVGYTLHGRLLRPATVIVSSGPEHNGTGED